MLTNGKAGNKSKFANQKGGGPKSKFGKNKARSQKSESEESSEHEVENTETRFIDNGMGVYTEKKESTVIKKTNMTTEWKVIDNKQPNGTKRQKTVKKKKENKDHESGKIFPYNYI